MGANLTNQPTSSLNSVDDRDRALQLQDKVQNIDPRKPDLAAFSFGGKDALAGMSIANAAQQAELEIRSRAPAEIPGISGEDIARMTEIVKHSMTEREGAQRNRPTNSNEPRSPLRPSSAPQGQADAITISQPDGELIAIQNPEAMREPVINSERLGQPLPIGQRLSTPLAVPLFQLDPQRSLTPFAISQSRHQLDQYRKDLSNAA